MAVGNFRFLGARHIFGHRARIAGMRMRVMIGDRLVARSEYEDQILYWNWQVDDDAWVITEGSVIVVLEQENIPHAEEDYWVLRHMRMEQY